MTQAPDTCRRCGRDLLHMPDRGNYCCCLKPAASDTAAPAADRAVSELPALLLNLVGWLEGGCDPRKAAEELRLLATRALAPPADRAELAEKAKAVHRRRSAIKCGILTAAECDRLDAELDSLIDALARSTDAPSEPRALTDEACDKAAAQTMDRVAAAKGIEHAMHLNADITTNHTLRRELIRAGYALAAPPAAATSAQEKRERGSAVDDTQRMGLPDLPEWSLRDDLGGLVPSEIRVELRAYARRAIAATPAAATSTPCASGEALPLVSCEDAGKAAATTGSDPFAFLRGAEWYRAQALAAIQAPAVPAASEDASPRFCTGNPASCLFCDEECLRPPATRPQAIDAPRADTRRIDFLLGEEIRVDPTPQPGRALWSICFWSDYGMGRGDGDPDYCEDDLRQAIDARLDDGNVAPPARTPTAGNTEDARSMGAVSEAPKPIEEQASCADSGTSNVKFHVVRRKQGMLVALCGVDSDGVTMMSDQTSPARSVPVDCQCRRAACRAAFKAALTQAASTGGAAS